MLIDEEEFARSQSRLAKRLPDARGPLFRGNTLGFEGFFEPLQVVKSPRGFVVVHGASESAEIHRCHAIAVVESLVREE